MPVGLWAVQLDRPLTEKEAAGLLTLLPSERRERLLRTEAEKRREPLCAYAALRLALRRTYGWQELPQMARTDRGKPYFPGFPDLHFSLSHTEGAVLVGISDRPLGVDIQRIRPVSRRLLGRVAGEGEDFFSAWVRREARSKRTGVGVGAMLRKEMPMEEGEGFCLLETFPGYAAGVSARAEDLPGTLWVCALEDLIYLR